MAERKQEIRGWVGICDGAPTWTAYDKDHGDYAGARFMEFFKTKREAQQCFEGVRRATLIVDPAPPEERP